MNALVLEGGGMRGVFTAGVLDLLMENDISFDSLFGVSAGAGHACSYLSHQHGRAFAINTDYLGDKRYCGLYSLLTTGDLFGVDFIYRRIPEELNIYDYDAYERDSTRFYAVTTNCITGQAEYPQIADMKRDVIHVQASSSLPVVSRLVWIDDVPYLDGGIADSIPIEQSIRMGHDKNVVVLTQHKSYRKQPNRMLSLLKVRYARYPKLVESIRSRHERYNACLDLLEQMESRGEVFILRPPQPVDIKRVEKDLSRLRALYEQGYNEAKENLDALLAYLKS